MSAYEPKHHSVLGGGGRFCQPFTIGTPKFFHLPASLFRRVFFEDSLHPKCRKNPSQKCGKEQAYLHNNVSTLKSQSCYFQTEICYFYIWQTSRLHKSIGVIGSIVKNTWSTLTYSYNSIKRTCSIKRPGLDFFKKSLLNVPYYHKIAYRKHLNVLLY